MSLWKVSSELIRALASESSEAEEAVEALSASSSDSVADCFFSKENKS